MYSEGGSAHAVNCSKSSVTSHSPMGDVRAQDEKQLLPEALEPRKQPMGHWQARANMPQRDPPFLCSVPHESGAKGADLQTMGDRGGHHLGQQGAVQPQKHQTATKGMTL